MDWWPDMGDIIEDLKYYSDGTVSMGLAALCKRAIAEIEGWKKEACSLPIRLADDVEKAQQALADERSLRRDAEAALAENVSQEDDEAVRLREALAAEHRKVELMRAELREVRDEMDELSARMTRIAKQPLPGVGEER